MKDYLKLYLNKNKFKEKDTIIVVAEFKNNSCDCINDICFILKEPKGLIFLKSSLYINDLKCDVLYIKEMNIKVIDPFGTIRIKYEFTVDIVESSSWENITLCVSSYEYFTEPIEKSYPIYLYKEKLAFKSLSFENVVELPDEFFGIEEVSNVFSEVISLKEYKIKSIKGVSTEEEINTGNKLMIKGLLKQIIEYTINDETLTVKCTSNEEFFNLEVMLCEEIRDERKLESKININDIFFEVIDSNHILIITDIFVGIVN